MNSKQRQYAIYGIRLQPLNLFVMVSQESFKIIYRTVATSNPDNFWWKSL
jgi:hypothetical protein